VKRYYVEVAPGGLECRVIGPDGWQGPWRSTEPHGRRQVEADRRQRKMLIGVARSFGCLIFAVVGTWAALALAGLVWLLRSVMSS
jgi:hypothetical protein